MDIAELLGNKKLMKIIAYLIDNTDVIQRELIQKTRISKATVVKWIKFLEQKGLITRKTIGPANLVNINNENIIIKEIKKTKILLELEGIKRIRAEIYLYGSCARGDYDKDSDVDILMIGSIKRNEAMKDIEAISRKIKRNISFRIFTQMEWSEMYKKDRAFYERVEKDKVRLS